MEVQFDQLCKSSRSIEAVQQRATNPLLRAGLITRTVAAKKTRQLTCEEYLKMTHFTLYQKLMKNKEIFLPNLKISKNVASVKCKRVETVKTFSPEHHISL